jgi:hypothetical protein
VHLQLSSPPLFPLLLLPLLLISTHAATPVPPADIDHRFAPIDWQTPICLPDDWQKTLVGRDGSLLYDPAGPAAGFGLRITFALAETTSWQRQELLSPRVPIVRTLKQAGDLEILEETFAVPTLPPLLPISTPKPPALETQRLDDTPAHHDADHPPTGTAPAFRPPHSDVLLVRLRNGSAHPAIAHPNLVIETPLRTAPANDRQFDLGPSTRLLFAQPCTALHQTNNRAIATFKPITLPPRGEQTLAFTVTRCGTHFVPYPRSLTEAILSRRQAEQYWNQLDLPYNRIRVPDAGFQAQLEAAIRNLYQAREPRKNVTALRIHPTGGHGLGQADATRAWPHGNDDLYAALCQAAQRDARADTTTNLYTLANHASPLLCWREEPPPAGAPPTHIGEIPHNQTSADFIRRTRYALAIEHDDELHLLEALPIQWTRPGARTRLDRIRTAFGPLSIDLRIAPNGESATLHVTPPTDPPPRRILVHVEDWSRAAGLRKLSPTQPSSLTLPLK